METDVGLLIVHGIGNQSPGSLARLVSRSLGSNQSTSAVAAGAIAANDRSNDVQRLKIGERTVHVCEAHWADLSSPDNTPELRVAGYLLPDFLQTIAYLWQAFALRTFFLGKEVKPLSTRGFLAIAIVIALVSLAVVFALAVPEIRANDDVLALIVGIPILAFLVPSVIRYTRRSLAAVRAGLGRQPLLVQRAVATVCLPFLILIGYFRFLLLLVPVMTSVELLAALAFLVAVTTAVNQVGLMLILMWEDISAGLNALRIRRVRRWINRLGWAVLVLPLQSLTQTTKAWTRLISVVFARHAPATRWAAGLLIPAIYVAALFLLLVCALFMMFAALPAYVWLLPGHDGVVARLVVAIVLLAFVFGVIRVLLPVLDLILDISNYHLATPVERRVYFERLQQGFDRLQRTGCREIHVLAHSLGTVITYEWLTAKARGGEHPIQVLHTIGSPLDKFWFTDHPEHQRFIDESGSAVPPNLRWYNYWAWSDPVSGYLDHFGRDSGLVKNIRLKWLGVFLYSHVRYWTCQRVIDGIRAGLDEKVSA
jgi:hypothetical protein